MWDGARVGVERAGKVFGAHEVYGIEKFEEFMRSVPRDKRVFYNDIITDPEIGGIVMDSLQGPWGSAAFFLFDFYLAFLFIFIHILL